MLKDYVNRSSQVSPTEYGHVLLVPRVLECLPQRIDHDSLLLALHLAAEIDHLGAFATINHLHFQVRLLLIHCVSYKI